MGGPDAVFFSEPDELKAMVKLLREVEKALGEIPYDLTEKIKKNREFFRSLFVAKDMKAREILTKDNVRTIRRGYGLRTKYYDKVLGGKVKTNIEKGPPLKWKLLSKVCYILQYKKLIM